MDAGSISEITGNIVSGSLGELAAGSTAPAVGSATVDYIAELPQLALQLVAGFLQTIGL